jgi:hypothetical protein
MDSARNGGGLALAGYAGPNGEKIVDNRRERILLLQFSDDLTGGPHQPRGPSSRVPPYLYPRQASARLLRWSPAGNH